MLHCESTDFIKSVLQIKVDISECQRFELGIDCQNFGDFWIRFVVVVVLVVLVFYGCW